MDPVTITPHLHQLNRLRFVNCFLVSEDDGFTLVDTMIPRSADQILDAAKKAGGEIRRIAVTHGHGDHIGSLDALKEQLGDQVEVLIPEIDARIHAGDKAEYGKLPGSWPTVKTRPDVQLKAGDRVGSLEVVPTPGHTPGHVSFLDTRDRTIIVGDVFTSVGGLQVSNHFSFPFPLAAMATWDKQQDLESAKRLRGLDPALLVFGHGGVLRDPAAAMDKAIASAG